MPWNLVRLSEILYLSYLSWFFDIFYLSYVFIYSYICYMLCILTEHPPIAYLPCGTLSVCKMFSCIVPTWHTCLRFFILVFSYNLGWNQRRFENLVFPHLNFLFHVWVTGVTYHLVLSNSCLYAGTLFIVHSKFLRLHFARSLYIFFLVDWLLVFFPISSILFP